MARVCVAIFVVGAMLIIAGAERWGVARDEDGSRERTALAILTLGLLMLWLVMIFCASAPWAARGVAAG